MRLTFIFFSLFGVVGFGLASIDDPAVDSGDNGGIQGPDGEVGKPKDVCKSTCTFMCLLGMAPLQPIPERCPACNCNSVKRLKNGCLGLKCIQFGKKVRKCKKHKVDEKGCKLCDCLQW